MGTLQNFQKPSKKERREFRDESESESDKSEQESCKKPERPGKPGNSHSVQKMLTSFVNDKESEVQQSTRATGGVTGPTVNLKCDATIEVYKYNHNKRSSLWNTVVSLSEKHSDIQTLIKDLRSEYGLASDARRCQMATSILTSGSPEKTRRTSQVAKPSGRILCQDSIVALDSTV